MASLLQRAIQRRKAAKRLEGVSAADQEEIRREIALIAERNRLEVTPELFTVKQGSKGVLFPVLVNLFALVTLVVGVISFGALFEARREVPGAARAAMLTSAEGTVLSELQQQVQIELAERDAEIEAIRLRLARISSERDDIEAEIARREAEQRLLLEQRLGSDLSDERTRLEDLGLGLHEIESRLAEYEALRRNEIDNELAAYVADLRDERDRLIDELAGLQSSLEQDLDELARERDRIEQDMLAAMRSAEAELDSALAEMAELESMARRREQVDAQVVGLFASLRDAANSGRIDEAREEAANLRRLLNEPQIRSVRGENRWEVDLFIVDRLEAMLTPDSDIETPQTVDTLREQITEQIALGDEALQADDLETAQSHYQQALAAVPRLLDGHRFLLERAVQHELSLQESELRQRFATEVEQRLAAEVSETEVSETDELAKRLAAEVEQRLTAEIAEVEAERQRLATALERQRGESAAQIQALERQLTAREAELLDELERVAAARPETVVEAPAFDPQEIERLRAAARRLDVIESRYEEFLSGRPAQVSPGGATLLSARRMLDDVLSSSEIDDVLPGVAHDVARYQDAHFDAGREDAFAETVDVLYGLTVLSSVHERTDYLNRAIRSGSVDPAFRQLLEQLLELMGDVQTALR